MTQPPWPPQPPSAPQPGAWTGQYGGPLAPRPPRAPGQQQLGPTPQVRVSIDQFKRQGPRPGRWIAIVSAVVAVAVVAFGASQLLGSPVAPQHSPTPSRPVSSAAAHRTPSDRGSAWMSDARSASGWWEILSERWDGDRVELKVRVETDHGTTPIQFFVISNARGNEQYLAEEGASGRQPNLEGTTLRQGVAEGYVTLVMPRQECTLIMGSSPRNAISALVIGR